ncbi:MAG: Rrf2 family transcriptional regulator [Ekhidna sp.]
MFSRACEYAIKIMIYLAKIEDTQPDTRVGVKVIATSTESPEAFTAKILQELAKNELIKSFKGPNGGFTLNPEKEVTLENIVETIDGDRFLKSCVLGIKACSDKNPCPVHKQFATIREDCKRNLLSISIRDKKLLTVKVVS